MMDENLLKKISDKIFAMKYSRREIKLLLNYDEFGEIEFICREVRAKEEEVRKALEIIQKKANVKTLAKTTLIYNIMFFKKKQERKNII